MVLQNEREELLAAWRALTGNPSVEGWRTIPVAHGGLCHFLAGRHFPNNEEALLVGFTSVRIPPAEQLPQGRGFLVIRTELGGVDAGRVWVALCRQSAGSLDLFAMMANDIILTLAGLRDVDDERRFQVFLARIRAWQDFMQRGADSVLSPEAEIGLYGELEILRDIISVGLRMPAVIDAWQGPLDGIQDFTFGTGAIEVKSTVSPNGFPARVGSLEQLDDSLIRPIFLAGVRLALDASGRTLPEQVGEARSLLREEPAALGSFNSRLLHAGFLDAVSERYSRRFLRMGVRILPVSEYFPRLTRANIAIEIRKARYELDLDMVTSRNVELAEALKQLGVI